MRKEYIFIAVVLICLVIIYAFQGYTNRFLLLLMLGLGIIAKQVYDLKKNK